MVLTVQHISPEEANRFHSPRTFHNHFLKGIITEDSTTTFHVTVKPDFTDKPPNYVATTYNLPDFPALLWNYINAIPGDCQDWFFADLIFRGVRGSGYGLGVRPKGYVV